LNARRPELPPNRTHLPPWTRRRAYAQCRDDPPRAGPGFHSSGERRLLLELRNNLDINWAALRTLRIGTHSSVGSPNSRAIGSEPGSSRGLGCITTHLLIRRDKIEEWLRESINGGMERAVGTRQDCSVWLLGICNSDLIFTSI